MTDFPIPDGTTWVDETGREWTAHGSLVLADTSIASVRQELVEFLQVRHPQWQWYNYPPPNVKVPAVAVSPDDPYILPYTQGKGAVVWGLELTLIQSASKTDQALRRLEFMVAEIYQSLLLYPTATFLQFADVGVTELGGVDHLTGTISVAVTAKFENVQ